MEEFYKDMIQVVKRDPYRPKFHFIAPANWMNDPNGPIFYRGEYHMFYQHNPYETILSNIHWGHAKSKNLVNWEYLPIALTPSAEKNEWGCWSGCCVNNNDIPTIFYTSVRTDKSPKIYAEQWMATSTDDMITWQKYEGNPVMNLDLHSDLEIQDWRDPYVWKEGEDWYMVLGGHTIHPKKPAVFLYKSRDLQKWEFIHPLCLGEGKVGKNWECPNFFSLGNKHILIVSPHRNVIYNIGKYENHRFELGEWYILDYGRSFYAPNTMFDEKKRLIMWGWIMGGSNYNQNSLIEKMNGKKTGWNGCLTLPRILSLNNNEKLEMRPAPELEILRYNHQKFENITINPTNSLKIENIEDNCYEILAKIENIDADSFIFSLFPNNDSVYFDVINKEIKIGKEKAILSSQNKILLHIFLDRSVLEVYINYQETFTARLYPENIEETGIEIITTNGSLNLHSLNIWNIKTIW